MMALDRSPESFSPQMNSTSLFLWFKLVTPRVGPVLIPTEIIIDKGLQGDATYQKSKLYPFQFQRGRILKLVFFVPMFQLVTSRVGISFDPKGIIRIKLLEVHKEMLNTEYQSSNPSSFSEE